MFQTRLLSQTNDDMLRLSDRDPDDLIMSQSISSHDEEPFLDALNMDSQQAIDLSDGTSELTPTLSRHARFYDYADVTESVNGAEDRPFFDTLDTLTPIGSSSYAVPSTSTNKRLRSETPAIKAPTYLIDPLDFSCLDEPFEEGEASSFSDSTSLPETLAVHDSEDEEGAYPETHDVPDNLKDAHLKKMDRLCKQLSAVELEESQFDVYGFGPRPKKPLAEINELLEEMGVELTRLKYLPENSIYLLAEEMNPSYVTSRILRRRFLSQALYDPMKAAHAVMAFLKYKADLWGTEKLVKPITISDFNEGTLGALMNGHFQFLPKQDLGGRRVTFNNHCYLGGYTDGDDMARLTFYYEEVFWEEEEVTDQGHVYVQYRVGPSRATVTPQRKVLWKVLKHYSQTYSTRSVAHLCFDRSIPALRIFKHFGGIFQNRIRIHQGSSEEILQNLSSFGIDRNCIPIDENGDMKTENHLEWVKKRIRIEEAREKEKLLREEAQREAAEMELKRSLGHVMSPTGDESATPTVGESKMVIHPSSSDVLMGRGKHNRIHAGNLRLRVILEGHLEDYNAASRKGKKVVVENVRKQLEESAARFLEPLDGGIWTVADATKVLKKLNHDFRTLRTTLKKVESGRASKERIAEYVEP